MATRCLRASCAESAGARCAVACRRAASANVVRPSPRDSEWSPLALTMSQGPHGRTTSDTRRRPPTRSRNAYRRHMPCGCGGAVRLRRHPGRRLGIWLGERRDWFPKLRWKAGRPFLITSRRIAPSTIQDIVLLAGHQAGRCMSSCDGRRWRGASVSVISSRGHWVRRGRGTRGAADRRFRR